MGRIVAQTKVTNPLDGGKSLQCGMLVDTGAGALLLPALGRRNWAVFCVQRLSNSCWPTGKSCAAKPVRQWK